jgi:hypothetical protein
MLRLLPLLTFALVAAVVAAPVPREAGRPAFGASGLVTRAELDRVVFDSRPANENDRLRKLVAENLQPRRGFEKTAVAIHMPWHTFREGEPVPAYFVFKNGGGEDCGLDARLDLFGPHRVTWNSCSIDLFDRKTGKHVPVIGGGGWMCGGPPLVVVPAGGYYCVACDLGRTADGKPLPPGGYEVDWRYSWMRSAPARFTVLKSDEKPAAPKRRGAHFFTLSPDPDRERRPSKAGEPFVWNECGLQSVNGGEMAAALAVGHGGVYVPDILTVPASDRLVEVSVEWKPYRDGDRVAVTLKSRDPRKPVRFAELPQLHLQVETDGRELGREALEKLKDAQGRADETLVTPLTVEARLPADWRERAGVKGSARVAVLVTSGRVELPGEQWGLQKAKEDIRRADAWWEGVLRTPFAELQFPAGR